MFRYETKDGRVLEWTSLRVCVCTLCEEAFNSVGAFDHHLKARKGNPPHYHDDMPRNKRGYKVISLYDAEGLDKLSRKA